MMEIKLKRVYDKALKTDGYRVLVDRLWPRGLSKEEAKLHEWAKELAPSNTLRSWFDHIPENWQGFQKRYFLELQNNDAVQGFIEKNRHHRQVTLLYATKYDHLTHALILKEYLEKQNSERKKEHHHHHIES